MKRFILVFNEPDKNRLIAAGYNLLRFDGRSYIFENNIKDKNELLFSKVKSVTTDVLSFC